MLSILCAAIGVVPNRVQAETVYPRVEVPSLSPQVFATIEIVRRQTRFVRRDEGPRYVIYGPDAKAPPFPADLTAARGRSYIDGFAALAPHMNCRTDDVADAYEFLIQAAMLAYNGSHFDQTPGTAPLSCKIASWGANALDSKIHIYLGGAARFANLPDLRKQALYERAIVWSGYLLDNVARSRAGSAARVKACADAADTIRFLTGFRASRVHLTDVGLSIDDQAR